MSGWIAAFDHATWAFTNDRPIRYQDGAVRLITPRLGEPLHRRSGFNPASFRLG